MPQTILSFSRFLKRRMRNLCLGYLLPMLLYSDSIIPYLMIERQVRLGAMKMEAQGQPIKLVIVAVLLTGASLTWADSYMGDYKGTFLLANHGIAHGAVHAPDIIPSPASFMCRSLPA